MIRHLTALAAGVAVLLGAGGATLAHAEPSPTPPGPVVTAEARLAINVAFMREEERLARDLYRALAAQHSEALPFSRIDDSEQRHHDAMGVLLTRYGLADPSAGRAPGSYADPTLQKLYDDLLAKGRESLAAAYQAGIAVEKADIADLELVIRETSDPTAKATFERLLWGSQNHLRAFEAAAAGKPLQPGNAGPRWKNQNPSTGPGSRPGDRPGRGPGMGPRQNQQRPADCPRR